MPVANDNVHDRFARASTELTPARLAVGLGLIAAIGFGLLFAQEPMVHDALHDFRHSIGITCH